MGMREAKPLLVGLAFLVGAIVMSLIAIYPAEERWQESGSQEIELEGGIPLTNATLFEGSHPVVERILSLTISPPISASVKIDSQEIEFTGQKTLTLQEAPSSIAFYLSSPAEIHYTYSLRTHSKPWVWLGVPAALCSIIGMGLSVWGSAFYLASRAK